MATAFSGRKVGLPGRGVRSAAARPCACHDSQLFEACCQPLDCSDIPLKGAGRIVRPIGRDIVHVTKTRAWRRRISLVVVSAPPAEAGAPAQPRGGQGGGPWLKTCRTVCTFGGWPAESSGPVRCDRRLRRSQSPFQAISAGAKGASNAGAGGRSASSGGDWPTGRPPRMQDTRRSACFPAWAGSQRLRNVSAARTGRERNDGPPPEYSRAPREAPCPTPRSLPLGVAAYPNQASTSG
jgi:hypothetical protein